MAFSSAQKRLIDNGISQREYQIRFGAPCLDALTAFRDRDLRENKPPTPIPEEMLPIEPIRFSLSNQSAKVFDFNDDMVKLIKVALAHGFTKVSLASIFSQLTGKPITRYHIARAIPKKQKSARAPFSNKKR